jgi:hypothetical protein
MYKFAICVHSGGNQRRVGDVIAVAELQTGFLFEKKAVEKILKSIGRTGTPLQNVKRIELQKHSTAVNIYYDYLEKAPTCLNLEVRQALHVATTNPGRITVTDYYNPSKTNTTTILSDKKTTVCDLCLHTHQCDLVSGCIATKMRN